MLLTADTQKQGYVFDGFPATYEQVKLLATNHILPFAFIELEADNTECITRGIRDRYMRQSELRNTGIMSHEHIRADSDSIILKRLASYRNEIAPIKKFYSKEHQNWYTFDAKVNRWLLWEQVLEKVIFVTNDFQTFLLRELQGKACGLRSLCIMPHEMHEGLDKNLKHICPVSLVDDGEIFDMQGVKSYDTAAKFQKKFYRLADEAKLARFLEKPEYYVEKVKDKVPQSQAEYVESFSCKPSFNGFCPVNWVRNDKLELTWFVTNF